MKTYAYYSTATQIFKDADLGHLVSQAAEINARQGVTGMLMYINRCFFQIFEGPDEAVEMVWSRIRQDARHSGILVMLEEKIETRRFEDWSMGVLEVKNEADRSDVMFEISSHALKGKFNESTPKLIEVLTQSFYKTAV